MKPPLFVAVVLSVFALGFAVGRMSAPAASAPASPHASASAMMPAAAPSMAAPPAPAEGTLVSGTVAEVIQVPNYTYLRLQTPSGETWAAVSTTNAVAAGQAVTIAASTQMMDFASKSLNRTFPSIYFGEVAGGGAGAPGPGFQHPPTGASAASALAAVKKAEGVLDLRVADVHAEKAMLAGRTVRVRGLVTRVTGVSGRFYAHVKDGSGAAATKDDDLTIVLASEVKQDEVVAVEGRVALDRDVGIGAPVPVVLDDATLVGK